MQGKGFCFILFSLFISDAWGQIGTEFWFAAPEVTKKHADRPIILHLSSFSIAAKVTVSQPANSSFTPIVVNLPVNSSDTVDLTYLIDLIETKPPDTNLKTGILIKSDADITAYYEVRGGSYTTPNNSDLFALKGSNALGNKFFIPIQDQWSNAPIPGYNAWASFIIVATEDSTNITIIPSDSIVGHAAGIAFTITLNKGETYSATATSIAAGKHLTGSYVTSDKLITVTVNDDSVKPAGPNSGGWDLIGDQIIPVSIIGTKYIAVKGPSEDIYYDRIFIIATEDSTDLFINGSATPATRIDSSKSFSYQILSPATSVMVESSKPVYAFHVTGFGTELGGAILPPIGCTGSKSITITRSVATTFFLILLVEAGGEEYFLENGLAKISYGDFLDVPGTGGAWRSTLVTYDDPTYPEVGKAFRITNSKKNFHLGVINKTGQYGSGCMYGFFSDFGTLELGPDVTACSNDNATLNAGKGKDSYLWSTGETTQIIKVKSPDPSVVYRDTISVTVKKGTCTLSDKVAVTIYPSPVISIPSSIQMCFNDSVILHGGSGFKKYLWSNGSTDSILLIKNPEAYWLEVENSYGCVTKKYTTVSSFNPLVTLELGPAIVGCSNDTITLDAGKGKDSYLWSTGQTTQTIKVKNPNPGQVYNDTISVYAPIGVCKFSDSVAVTIKPSPVITALTDQAKICINDSVTLKADGGFAHYLWDNGSTDTFLLAKLNAVHWVEVTNTYGCKTKKFSAVIVIDSPRVLLDDRLICTGTSTTFYPGEFDSYLWQDGSTSSSFVASKAGTYTVRVTNICGSATGDITLGFWNIFTTNLFTPNNDGHNDTFFFQGIEKGEWQLSVYNRWGQRVYFSEHYDNSWNASNLVDGVYYYYLEEQSPCNKFKGWVDIKR